MVRLCLPTTLYLGPKMFSYVEGIYELLWFSCSELWMNEQGEK